MKNCKFINKSIVFNYDCIMPCINSFSYNAPCYWKNVADDANTLNVEKRKQYIIDEINSSNLIRYSCKECICFEDTEDKIQAGSNKYDYILLNHWKTCNANCFYCVNHEHHVFGSKQIYNPYEIIKNLYEKGLIDTENLVVTFHGGDIGTLENFDEYILLFEKYGFKMINFSSNNIIYQPTIEKLLEQGKASFNLTLACSDRNNYLKIKRVDKYDVCIENLKKYLKVVKNKELINVHYIILRGYNDSKEEIDKFIKLMKNLGVVVIGVRVDRRDLDKFIQHIVPLRVISKYKKLYDYFIKSAQKNSFILDQDSNAEECFVINQCNKNENILKKIKNLLNKLKINS